jgi:hypothetical protein
LQLLYTTSDRAFSELVMLTLNGEGIQVHVSDVDPALLGSPLMMREYRIYLVHDEDYARANELLIQLNAAREKPYVLPRGAWFRWLMLALGVLLAALVILPG